MATATSALQNGLRLREELFGVERIRMGTNQELTEAQSAQIAQDLERRAKEQNELIADLTQINKIEKVRVEESNMVIAMQNETVKETERNVRLAKADLRWWSIALLIVIIASLVICVGITVYRYI